MCKAKGNCHIIFLASKDEKWDRDLNMCRAMGGDEFSRADDDDDYIS